MNGYVPTLITLWAYVWYRFSGPFHGSEITNTREFYTGGCVEKFGSTVGRFNHTETFYLNTTSMNECVHIHHDLHKRLEMPLHHLAWYWPLFLQFYEDGCIIDGIWATCGNFICPYTVNFTSCFWNASSANA